MTVRCLLPILLFCFLIASVQAQVGKVKERAREHKSSGSSPGSFSFSDNEGSAEENDFLAAVIAEIGWELIQLPFRGFYYWQKDHLDRARSEAWRVSAEGYFGGGWEPSRGTYFFEPSARVNWGLFSTQLRYNRLFDATGTLTTLDWQVMQFNIAHNEYFRLVYGVGLSHEVEIDQSHFESLIEVDVFLLQRRLQPQAIVRWSDDGYPRNEIAAKIHYSIGSREHFQNTVYAGYTFQDWYDVPFHFITAGFGFTVK